MQSHVVTHLAWFHRDAGVWLAEWRGLLPAVDYPELATRDERERLRTEWLSHWARRLGDPGVRTLEECRDPERWDACGPGEAVCCDVTDQQWLVGDFVWHRWDEKAQRPAADPSSEHRFLEVDVATLRVTANVISCRPVRTDPSRGRVVVDITGTPWAAFCGSISGTFVWRGDRWGFDPAPRWRWKWRRPVWSLRYNARPTMPRAVRLALAAPTVDLDPVVSQVRRGVPVEARA